AESGEQIGLLARFVVGQARLHTVALEPVAHPFDQAEVRLAARGVEGDKTLDHVPGLGADRQNGFGLHGLRREVGNNGRCYTVRYAVPAGSTIVNAPDADPACRAADPPRD